MGGILWFIVLILDIVAIVNVIKSPKDIEKKVLWIVLIIVLPVVGMVVYFLLGQSRNTAIKL